MAKEKDEDADREPESKAEIHERRQEKAEISSRYTEAKSKLPDDPRDDPWAYTGLLTRNPAKNITPPLWEAIKSEVYRVYLNAGTEFCNSDTISTIAEQGLELVMQSRKSGKIINHFLNGMVRADLRSSYYPFVGGISATERAGQRRETEWSHNRSYGRKPA